MKESNHYTETLISKFLSGNSSSKEKIKFEEWLNASADNKKKFQQYRKAWEASQQPISPKNKKKDKEVVLTKIQRWQNQQFLLTRRKLFIYKIAALLAVPVTFTLSWTFMNKSVWPENNLLTEVEAPKGHVAKCILPDGTGVWVNTGSAITYNPESFNHNNREIELSGEAYFEVSKNEEIPFKVTTTFANINVTGTSFNVKAYTEEKTFETVLAEGSIEMELNNQSRQKINLTSGERAVYQENKKDIFIEKTEAELYTSWRNGEILFKDATLNDLVKELERIYDIQFYLKNPKLGDFRFRGMFSYNNNLIEALEKIKRTANIDYYIEHKEVWLYTSQTDINNFN